ncbi:MAG: hypothetical protein GX434_07355 [Peptococcaceae bacterium]|nr:hypothetical protein [Peptococcaceae bacterium]
MKLFEILPPKFFNLLSGKNRQIYAEAALLLFEQSQVERFGIPYDIMRDLMQELIETQEEFGLVFFDEEDESAEAEQRYTGSFSVIGKEEQDLFRAKANAALRRMQQIGWIQVEERDNFKQYIVLPHYTSRIVSVLKEICEARTVEYQRFTFLTYQLITGEEVKLRPSFVVVEAEKLTRQFQQELIALYNNMKYHMEQVALKTSVQEVLNHHFEQYKAQIVDRSYHRLKTSDHVARYRFLILDTVQRWLLDQDWLAEAIEDGVRSELFADKEEAETALYSALYEVEKIYNELDEVFYHVDIRHNQYLRASYDRARYLSHHTQGIDQQIAGVLEGLAQKQSDNAFLEALFSAISFSSLQRTSQLSEKSLFSPRKKRGPLQPEEHIVVPVPDQLKAELRKANLTRLRKAVTREKVKAFVLERLGQRNEMLMDELAPKNLEEFLLFSHIYLYGYDGRAGFRLIRSKKPRIICMERYRFHAHRIIKNAEKGGLRCAGRSK